METLTEFFDRINDCEVTDLEIYNKVETLTDNFNLEKLLILHRDFETYLLIEKEERESECKQDEIDKAIEHFKQINRPLPYKKVAKLEFDKDKKPIHKGEYWEFLDLEKLIFPLDFFCCYQFKNFLVNEINKKQHKNKLPQFETLNWIGIANGLKPSYLERCAEWLEARPECNETDFIEAELEHWENDLKEPFTVGSTWDRYKKIVSGYLLFLKSKFESKNFEVSAIPDSKKNEINSGDNKYTFENLFATNDWQKYIDVLQICEPALINDKREFIGMSRTHKGFICSWIKYLQNKGIIKPNIKRSELSKYLNNEIKGIDIGADGKSFDNVSNAYRKSFEKQLIDLLS